MDEKMNMEEILKLVEEKQYTRLRQILVDWNEADIAAFLEELPHEEQIKVFRILPKSIAADVFSFLPVEIEHIASIDRLLIHTDTSDPVYAFLNGEIFFKIDKLDRHEASGGIFGITQKMVDIPSRLGVRIRQ